ncbi:MAG: hypothetical protein ACI3V2_09280 [Faecousia sp.]
MYSYFRALKSRQDTARMMEGKRRIKTGADNKLGIIGAKADVNDEVVQRSAAVRRNDDAPAADEWRARLGILY